MRIFQFIYLVILLTELSNGQNKLVNEDHWKTIIPDTSHNKQYPYYEMAKLNGVSEYVERFFGEDRSSDTSDFIPDWYPDKMPVFYGITDSKDSLSFKDYSNLFKEDLGNKGIYLKIIIGWTGEIWGINYFSKIKMSDENILKKYCRGLRATKATIAKVPVPIMVSVPIK
jgi:hypothetical protein